MQKKFCALPFIAIDKKQQRYRPCCHYRDDHWPQFQSIDHYWNSPELAELRRDFVAGRENPGCEYCWTQESLGITSLRQSLKSERTADAENPKLKQIKLVTSKTCNLACMMCFDTVSSGYENLWQGHTFPVISQHVPNNMTYDWEIDRLIREDDGSLEFIEVLGGEPLFNKDFLDLAQHLVDTGKSQNLTLFISTNCTLLTEKIRTLFRQFRKTVFMISIDGIGPVNEYQRWPSRWAEVERNLTIFADNFDVSIHPTVTAVNIARMHEVHEYCEARNLMILNTSIVKGWEILHPRNLPDEIKARVDSRFHGLIGGSGDPDTLGNFIKSWDQRRSINIVDYMPEWQDLIKEN